MVKTWAGFGMAISKDYARTLSTHIAVSVLKTSGVRMEVAGFENKVFKTNAELTIDSQKLQQIKSLY